MTLQDDFNAALEQVAAGKRQQQAEAQASHTKQQAQADSGAEWFRRQFELLDADGQPAKPLPTTDTHPDDIFNIFPRF